jgi:hypothetical protein
LHLFINRPLCDADAPLAASLARSMTTATQFQPAGTARLDHRARDAGAARDGVCRLRRKSSFPNNTELLRGFMVNASSGSWTLVNKTGY